MGKEVKEAPAKRTPKRKKSHTPYRKDSLLANSESSFRNQLHQSTRRVSSNGEAFLDELREGDGEIVPFVISRIEEGGAGVRVSELAEELGISRAWLTALLKRKTGLTFRELRLLILRVRARELMSREPTLKLCARALGYPHYRSFHRLWKASGKAFRDECVRRHRKNNTGGT